MHRENSGSIAISATCATSMLTCSLAELAEPAEPGGWNRFAIEVADLDALVGTLRAAGARFRNDIVTGVGGRQILVEDPSGNPVELFEPTQPEARLSQPAS
jgi:catechol 2,3-dioxygenase-like lactoylglutathione lyase family enzyme